MVEVLPWQAADPHEAARTAALHLEQGRVVAVPTETIYQLAASGLVPEAVERLSDDAAPLTLALRHPAELADWVPELSTLGRRLSRRCWPGPVTLIFTAGLANGLAERLPDSVRQRLCPDGELRVSVSGHPALGEVLRWLPAPLVLAAPGHNDDSNPVDAAGIRDHLGDRVDLLLDDGPCQFGQPATEVRVTGDRWEVPRPGVVPDDIIQQLSGCFVLFVCTGNTCRSPLAAGLCRKLLAERLGCAPDELNRRGFVVHSAGISAMMGCEATPEAMATAAARGVDLSAHVSRPVTAAMLVEADHVFAMTRGHLWAIISRVPSAGPNVRLLDPGGGDIPDPIGGEQAVYDECAEHLVAALRAQLPKVCG